jgi:hypothetical protein
VLDALRAQVELVNMARPTTMLACTVCQNGGDFDFLSIVEGHIFSCTKATVSIGLADAIDVNQSTASWM